MNLNIFLLDNVFFADGYLAKNIQRQDCFVCGNLNEEPSPDSLVLKLAALPQIDQILPVSLESLITSRLDTDVVGARCQTPGPCYGHNLPANRTVCRPGQVFILEVIR